MAPAACTACGQEFGSRKALSRHLKSSECGSAGTHEGSKAGSGTNAPTCLLLLYGQRAGRGEVAREAVLRTFLSADPNSKPDRASFAWHGDTASAAAVFVAPCSKDAIAGVEAELSRKSNKEEVVRDSIVLGCAEVQGLHAELDCDRLTWEYILPLSLLANEICDSDTDAFEPQVAGSLTLLPRVLRTRVTNLLLRVLLL
eukprot:TRINITY_DN107874_c0_g1_i1.p1 TRINITY_DN107874_c0_g1~~TRINITY_DN107874_c0_g1_i1.p1  ORF type:complete len:200 (+),score=39.08 TRINITY_DN107874_c0_g1_i1:32-631(+)